MRLISRGIVVLALTATLSSCGLGTLQTQTAGMEPVGNGVDTAVGDLKVQGVTLVTNGAGVVSLVASIINPTLDADAVIGVQINGVDALLTPVNLTVAPRKSLQLGYQSGAHVDAALDLEAGTYADISFVFAGAGQLDVSALIVEATGSYANVTPAPNLVVEPTESASPTL